MDKTTKTEISFIFKNLFTTMKINKTLLKYEYIFNVLMVSLEDIWEVGFWGQSKVVDG